MFFGCEIWCLADVSSVSPSSEQTCSKLPADRQELHESVIQSYLAPWRETEINPFLGARRKNWGQRGRGKEKLFFP